MVQLYTQSGDESHVRGVCLEALAMSARVPLLALALLTSGCYTAMPPAFGESTEVLPPHAVGMSLVGGGGGLASTNGFTSQGAAGGEARVRVGVSGNQELGLSGFGGANVGSSPFVLFGGAISYKGAPVPWLAFVVRAGVMGQGAPSDSTLTPVFAADLAAILAPYTSKSGTQLYTGVRGGFGIPVVQGATGSVELFTAPLGLWFHSGGDVRMFVEGGPVVAFTQSHSSDIMMNGSSPWLGGYGALGVEVLIR